MSRTTQVKNNWENVHAEIFQHLDLRAEFAALGVEITGSEPNAGGWVTARAVNREDAQPSAAVNIEYGRYKDSGGDGLSCSLFDLAVKLGKATDWKSARKYYAKKAGIRLPGGRELQDPAEHLKFRPWNEALVKLFCDAKPGITPQSLRDFGGRIAQYHKQYTVIALPIFGPDLNNADPVGYVLYQINCKPLPVFQGKAEPARWVKMKTTSGSKPGLLGPFCSPIYNPNAAVVWKTEGPADALALWADFPPDVQAMATVVTNANGATETPKDTMAVAFAGKKTILVHDADSAGETGAAKWLPWLSQIAQEVRHVRLPYQIEPSHGKDVRDYLTADGGTVGDLVAMARAAGTWTQEVATSLLDTATKPQMSTASSSAPTIIEADDDPYRLARIFLTKRGGVGDDLTLRFWKQTWFLWRKNCYCEFSPQQLRADVSNFCKAEFDRLHLEDVIMASVDEKPTAKKVSKNLVSNVILALESLCIGETDAIGNAIKFGQWLADPKGVKPSLLDEYKQKHLDHIVPGQDGLLYLPLLLTRPSDCFLEATPRFFNMMCVTSNVRPRPDVLEPKQWLAFLNSVWPNDPESIKALQLWFGYVLTRDTRQQKILFIAGPKRSGKGTIASVLHALHAGSTASPTLASLAGSFGLTGLVGKTLAIVPDARMPQRDATMIVERLLSISGEDTMWIERKFKDPLCEQLTCRIMILTNELMVAKDAAAALASRMIVLSMSQSFFGREDPTLRASLLSELESIFWWAVDGWIDLQGRGVLLQPESGKKLVQELEDLASPVLQFAREFCELGPNYSVSKESLYKAFCAWCDQNGRRIPSVAVFFRNLRAAVPTLDQARIRSDGMRVRVLSGMKLRPFASDVFV